MVLFIGAMRIGLYVRPKSARLTGTSASSRTSPAVAETFASKESGRVRPRTVRLPVTRTPSLAGCTPSAPAKINLIPFNPWPGTQYECSDWEQIEKFSEVIFNAGYASPVRTPRGRDILAACGQLKSATEKLCARERLALRAMAMTD